MRKCRNCSKEYDETAFSVKIGPNEYMSYLCRECAEKDDAIKKGDVVIIENTRKEQTQETS